MQSESISLRAARPKPGDVLAGKYRIEGMLGEGGMGSVYAARNLATGKRVALKWVLAERATDHELLQRFQREARAAGRIDHPNVVSVYDVGQHGPSTFLVMELLHGHPLSKLMQQGPLPTEVAISLVMPALRGIAAAHAQGVIHRDLKPDNIFLCTAPDGTPRETKVLDFGVSKMTDEVREGLSVTKTGAVVGTPYYMSPEQVRGMRDLDARLDVYAMGVILYEMLARRPPFLAESYSALVIEIATGTPPSLVSLRPDVDPKLIDVITKAMERDREHRFQDIESFAKALEPFGGGIRFKERPDWTDKIITPKGLPTFETDPANATDPDASGLRLSQQATMASDRVAHDVLDEAPTESALPVIEEASLRTNAVRAVAAPAPPWHSGTEQPSVAIPAPKKRWWLIGAVLVVLAVLGALVISSQEDEAPPRAAQEPTRTVAAPTPPLPAPPADLDEPATEVPVDRPSETAAPPDEIEEPAPRRRARGTAKRRLTAAPASMEEAPTQASRPRAGSLSLEDF